MSERNYKDAAYKRNITQHKLTTKFQPKKRLKNLKAKPQQKPLQDGVSYNSEI